MSIWEPFTERARRSIVLAQEEAQALGQVYIGTEHVVLGILSESGSAAARVLSSNEVTLANYRGEVRRIVGSKDRVDQAEMVLTPRTKRAIQLAIERAKTLGQNYVGTEHLLLGIIAEGQGVGYRALRKLTDVAAIEDEVMASLRPTKEAAQPGEPAGRTTEPPSEPAAPSPDEREALAHMALEFANGCTIEKAETVYDRGDQVWTHYIDKAYRFADAALARLRVVGRDAEADDVAMDRVTAAVLAHIDERGWHPADRRGFAESIAAAALRAGNDGEKPC